MTTDPYSLLRQDDWPECAGDPMAQAAAAFDPLAPDRLRSLLLDQDPLVRGRGLNVFGALGRKGFVVLDAALTSIHDPSLYARSNLMDGVISFSRQLNATQARRVLELADDPEDLVREKVVAFLGAAAEDIIASAIELFQEPRRADYRKGFSKFSAEPSQVQLLLDEGLADTSVPATFALAAIQRMARDGRLVAVPQYSGGSYVARGVLANAARLMKRVRSGPQ